MERNQFIGIVLISVTLFLWLRTMQPKAETDTVQKVEQDTSSQVSTQDTFSLSNENSLNTNVGENTKDRDSIAKVREYQKLGAFGAAEKPAQSTYILENDLVKFTFSAKGGFISEALLKNQYTTQYDSQNVATKSLVKLLSSPENRFEYVLPMKDRTISTMDLYFSGVVSGNTLVLTAATEKGKFVQEYSLEPDSYTLDYNLKTENLGQEMDANVHDLKLHWVDHLAKLERGEQFEQNYSTVYFKVQDKRKDYCRCTADDDKNLEGKSLEWVSHTNQFFNASLMASGGYFMGGDQITRKTDLKTSPYVKVVTSDLSVPMGNWDNGHFKMKMYVGPNEFKRLQVFNNDLEEVIPFGSSIFGTINRWFIRPFFDFLSGFIGSKGIVIIILIFLIKMLLYPLMYKSLYSQAKMGALKPELAHLKEKYKDDTQKQQMETMKIYREYGVSPFGGCMPMLLQMPIWYALFRFFPASITFRQEPFLWATDLSSYDVLFYLPFDIPFFGSHVSLFTLLWAVSTIVYTYYNMQNVDLTANPAMKYVQYIMPVMFLAFFNNYASGLTAYMFFSNLINIIQTVVTKNYIFDEKKIREQLLKEKDKPKKKSVFQSKLEEAMKQQQAIQDQRSKSKK